MRHPNEVLPAWWVGWVAQGDGDVSFIVWLYVVNKCYEWVGDNDADSCKNAIVNSCARKMASPKANSQRQFPEIPGGGRGVGI